MVSSNSGAPHPDVKAFSFLQCATLYEWSFALGARYMYVGWPINVIILSASLSSVTKQKVVCLAFAKGRKWNLLKVPLVLLFYYLHVQYERSYTLKMYLVKDDIKCRNITKQCCQFCGIQIFYFFKYFLGQYLVSVGAHSANYMYGRTCASLLKTSLTRLQQILFFSVSQVNSTVSSTSASWWPPFHTVCRCFPNITKQNCSTNLFLLEFLCLPFAKLKTWEDRVFCTVLKVKWRVCVSWFVHPLET